MKTTTAKFAGECSICQKAIKPEKSWLFTWGSGRLHADCLDRVTGEQECPGYLDPVEFAQQRAAERARYEAACAAKAAKTAAPKAERALDSVAYFNGTGMNGGWGE